jgi:predicted SAM-dependent methyltransferase
MKIPFYDICDPRYRPTLIDSLKFEAKSLYGRTFMNSKPPLNKEGNNLLHLGCSNNKFENWINADFFNSSKTADWMLDLRYPLNCKDNVWDGVFTEHTIEHLYPDHVMNLLKELHRTMNTNAWIRITVPDLQKYINYYCGKEVDREFSKFRTGCEAIRTLTQDYIHLSTWDINLLTIFLEEAGFENIKEVSFMEGTNKILVKDKKERSWETLYVEAQKNG